MKSSLNDLIAQGEGVRLEFKSSISTAARIARTLAAFANTAGGTLLIGIGDDGRVTGVESEYREMQKIEKATDFHVDPALLVSYEKLAVEGKHILVIEVAESTDKPHYAIDEQGNRTIYVRSRDKSVPTSKLILSPALTDTQLLQSPMVRTLLQFLRKNDTITAAKLAQLVNISDSRANKLLRQLAEQGLLLMIDRPRPVRYSLKVSE
ncbi:ATP-binding protein [Nibrella saemangeumensis]|uniref:ATP-binding protein n=1 Tax=Nibrella saemangeumensis TaxID=1084526 RepID=A0ABP8NCT3_9BACT